MISNEGSDSSISISRVLAFGNILSKSLRIGDIAKPGSDTTAEIESMATRATREILPLPVEIFIVERFSPPMCNRCATKKRVSTIVNTLLKLRYSRLPREEWVLQHKLVNILAYCSDVCFVLWVRQYAVDKLCDVVHLILLQTTSCDGWSTETQT